MQCDFSYGHYRAMLKKALSAGFVITMFKDYKKNAKASKLIILRHDVDYLPKRALDIAKIEKSLGLKSTFFIRVHGEHYHPLDSQTFKYLKNILELGHEIGLHYEARTYAKKAGKKLGQSSLDIFRWEKKIIETIFNIKIESASEHRDLDGITPGHKFFTNQDLVGINQETYDNRFQDFYLADSCNRWNHNNRCLCEHLEEQKIQLLTHPDLWGNGAKAEVDKKIRAIGLKPTY